MKGRAETYLVWIVVAPRLVYRLDGVYLFETTNAEINLRVKDPTVSQPVDALVT